MPGTSPGMTNFSREVILVGVRSEQPTQACWLFQPVLDEVVTGIDQFAFSADNSGALW